MKKHLSIFKTKISKRRGFTVAELVVALAVILIVSSAAITFISVQTNTEARAIATVEATNMAENAIECFRFAKRNNRGFKEWFEYCGCTLEGEGTQEKPYVAQKNGVTAEIVINGNTIKIVAEWNNKEILETEYTYPAT